MKRPIFIDKITTQFFIHPICALIGPRQVGKTTLAKMFADKYPEKDVVIFDLENPIDLAKLENPHILLSSLENKLIIIDEIQRKPDLFPILRVLADDKKKNQKFLILGSASKELIQKSSETLAGRIGYIELMPFSLEEVNDYQKLWMRGGFPLSYLAENEKNSFLWRESYISTFLERDIPNLGFQVPHQQMRRFWLMLAHYHGQIFNASELGRSLGLSGHTIRKYLDILNGTFMVRTLLPWHENLKKRQIKSPKIYFRDSGIIHALLGIQNYSELHTYPKLGAFWEGFALEEIIRQLQMPQENCYFWSTQSGAELDLLIFKEGKRIGFECKYADSPKVTKSMHIAIEDLGLDHLYIISPGDHLFPMENKKITALGIKTPLPEIL